MVTLENNEFYNIELFLRELFFRIDHWFCPLKPHLQTFHIQLNDKLGTEIFAMNPCLGEHHFNLSIILLHCKGN